MALVQNTSIKLQDCSLGIQHEVMNGQTMDGEQPADTAPSFDTERKVLIYDAPAGGQMGLFDPHPFANSGVFPFLAGLQIQQGGGSAWDVYLTCGDPSLGTPSDVEVHDPAYDMLIASSADFGTGAVALSPGIELLPNQLVRVVLPAANLDVSRVIAMFCNTIGAGGRLIK